MDTLGFILLSALLCHAVGVITQNSCRYNNVVISSNLFKLSPCISCRCNQSSGFLTCWHEGCKVLTLEDCIKGDSIDCCNQCSQYGCFHKQNFYPKGAKIPSDNQCSDCSCQGQANNAFGVICKNQTCPPSNCANPVQLDGKCCSECKQPHRSV